MKLVLWRLFVVLTAPLWIVLFFAYLLGMASFAIGYSFLGPIVKYVATGEWDHGSLSAGDYFDALMSNPRWLWFGKAKQ